MIDPFRRFCPRNHQLTPETSHVEHDDETMRSWIVCHTCEEQDPRKTWHRLFGAAPDDEGKTTCLVT